MRLACRELPKPARPPCSFIVKCLGACCTTPAGYCSQLRKLRGLSPSRPDTDAVRVSGPPSPGTASAVGHGQADPSPPVKASRGISLRHACKAGSAALRLTPGGCGYRLLATTVPGAPGCLRGVCDLRVGEDYQAGAGCRGVGEAQRGLGALGEE